MSRDNICHTSKSIGIVAKKIFAENFADTKKILRVDRRLVVQALQCAPVDIQLLGEPSVGTVLVAQFFADKVAYVYLHTVCYLCAWLPIPSQPFRQPQKKRRRAISSPVSGRRKYLLRIDKMLAQ